jgi:TonB family protein
MSSTAASNASQELQSLFTGDSLRGWVVDDASFNHVEATGGILRLSEAAGWLRTENTKFDSFALRFNVRAVTNDSRAMVAILGIPATKGNAGSAYAFPLFSGSLPDRTASPTFRVMLLEVNAAGQANVLRPTGDWQTYEIVRSEARITANVNGVMILDQYGPRSLDGWIGFRTQQGPIELRNIELRAVPPPTARSVYRAGPGVTLPRVVHEERPRYTAEAMRLAIQGTVLMECVVEANGAVSQAVVVRSLDSQHGLDAEAVRAARQWRFTPGTKDGQPVSVLVTMELTFTLKR